MCHKPLPARLLSSPLLDGKIRPRQPLGSPSAPPEARSKLAIFPHRIPPLNQLHVAYQPPAAGLRRALGALGGFQAAARIRLCQAT